MYFQLLLKINKITDKNTEGVFGLYGINGMKLKLGKREIKVKTFYLTRVVDACDAYREASFCGEVILACVYTFGLDGIFNTYYLNYVLT